MIFLWKIFIFILCIRIFYLNVYLYTLYMPIVSEGIKFPGKWSYRVLWMSMCLIEIKPMSSGSQLVLLTTEPCLQLKKNELSSSAKYQNVFYSFLLNFSRSFRRLKNIHIIILLFGLCYSQPNFKCVSG